MRIFRLRTLSAANGTAVLLASAVFSQFFLLTLYMQQVLHYSAIKTGLAYIGLTMSIIAFSVVAQTLATRVGVRRVLPIGLLLSASGLVLYARLPVHGHYFWDVFPAFLLSGIGLALAFVPVQIASLTGVRSSDAGIASGLINTSQQVGGAIGLAAASTIATTYSSHYVSVRAGISSGSPAALTHGFSIAFYVLAALAALGAIVAAVFIESRPAEPGEEPVEAGELALEAAA
jgi:MFS family permease